MLFNSIQFFVFFIIVTVLYFMLPYKYRWQLLLISSCYFYMAFVPVYILILGLVIIVDYFAGIKIENSEGQAKKNWLRLSIASNIAILVFFKYYNFINDSIWSIISSISNGLFNQPNIDNPIPYLTILLPIGLSFHTFQAMSYTIEVYNGNQKAEKHFGLYSLYVMFYPQLVAGPIERPQAILKQFRQNFDFDYNRVTSGLRLMGWGLFKKVVIADRLAIAVDTVYASPYNLNSVSLFIAIIFFAFQIFCDFSGYCDIAIGAARVMGYDLMRNFKNPFSAKSITEFWKKWNISLSTWFADYFYTPLAIKRRNWGVWSVVYASMITFLLLGLWHGANWNFIIYGGLHGVALSIEFLTRKSRKKIRSKLPHYVNDSLGVIYVFLFFAFSLIFFRTGDFNTAIYIIKHTFKGLYFLFTGYFNNHVVFENIGLYKDEFLIAIILIVFMQIVYYFKYKIDLERFFLRLPVFVRWFVYFTLLYVVLIYGVFENRQFIYFQF